MAYLLALTSAALYGAADFLGGLASRRASTIPIVIVSQVAGILALVPLLLVLPASPARPDFIWGAVAGVAGSIGVGLLYRGLAIGQMAVVAPTTAVCAVMLPVLVEAIRGERLPVLTLAGIALALVGIVLVSRSGPVTAGPNQPPLKLRRSAVAQAKAEGPALRVAILSGVAIGFFFLSLARTSPAAGLWPLLAARSVSFTLFGAIVLFGSRSVRMPRPVLTLTIACGFVDMLANALYLFATRYGALSIVVTLSSLYPASTVVLARIVIGERLTGAQAVGIGCALLAVIVIVGAPRW